MTNSVVQKTVSSDAAHSSARETIVVAGEFEVGKSSVVNAMLRRPLLPNDPGFLSRPLVRIRHRAVDQMIAELTDGTSIEIGSPDSIIERDDISVLTIHTPMPGLEAVEVIEVPFHPSSGFKDEHLNLMGQANLFVWVTIASQAWRLSEKSIVQSLPNDMPNRSVLAISRSDKLRSPSDLDKIETRLQKEAVGHFSEIVFMQASVKRLDACHESVQQWEETGGHALVEIARDVIGDISVSDEALLDAFDAPNLVRGTPETSLEQHSPITRDDQGIKSDSLDRFESWSQTSPSKSIQRPEEETENDLSLEELLQEVDSADDKIKQTIDVSDAPKSIEPLAGFKSSAVPSEEISSVSTTGLDNAADLLNDVTSPPEPEIPVVEAELDKLGLAIASVTGLETAGIIDRDTQQLQICFVENRFTAEQCRQVFLDLIECSIRELQFADGGTFQETTIAIGDWVILLQTCEGSREQFAFFVLERHQTNPAISSVQTRRLLKVWYDSPEGMASGDELTSQVA